MRPSEAVRNGVLETRSEAETRALGVRLARGLRPGAAVGLMGPLGAGKTVLAQGIAEGLGCAQKASSPSFTLVNVYEGAIPVYHIDFYRLSGEEEVESLGFRDYLDGRGVVLVEWADRVPGSLPAERLEVTLRRIDDQRRSLTFRAFGEAAERTLQHL
jgi:tRNA threonylcarbamoyladenosine biosynthesis protein TsaE